MACTVLKAISNKLRLAVSSSKDKDNRVRKVRRLRFSSNRRHREHPNKLMPLRLEDDTISNTNTMSGRVTKACMVRWDLADR